MTRVFVMLCVLVVTGICLFGLNHKLYYGQASMQEDDAVKTAPACIKKLISTIQTKDVWNPPARVFKGSHYKNSDLYFVPSRCFDCDSMSQLYDENCNIICHPSGGPTGKGDEKCPTNVTLNEFDMIWKDDRKHGYYFTS